MPFGLIILSSEFRLVLLHVFEFCINSTLEWLYHTLMSFFKDEVPVLFSESKCHYQTLTFPEMCQCPNQTYMQVLRKHFPMINIQSPKLEAPSLVTTTRICIYKAINNEQTKVLLIVHERFISSHACTPDQVKVLREFLEILNS